MRLQCYEGLDEAKALYEWNYRKQAAAHPDRVGRVRLGRGAGDIFGEEFLLERR